MATTFLDILRNVASQPWSIEDPDILSVEDVVEDNPKLALACQAANSFIFRLNELPFKNYEQNISTIANQPGYESPTGNIKEILCVGNTDPLRLDKNLSMLTPQYGRPNKYNRRVINAIDEIVLFPIPDNQYDLIVKYETFHTARRPQNGNYVEIPNLEKDEDILNIPPQYENMYLECLYAKTMYYLIIDNTDENWQPYDRKYNEALAVLLQATGLDFTKRIGF